MRKKKVNEEITYKAINPFILTENELMKIAKESFYFVQAKKIKSKNTEVINIDEAVIGLKYAFKKLHPLVSLPQSKFYESSLKKYKNSGKLTFNSFYQIILKHHDYQSRVFKKKALKNNVYRSSPIVKKPLISNKNNAEKIHILSPLLLKAKNKDNSLNKKLNDANSHKKNNYDSFLQFTGSVMYPKNVGKGLIHEHYEFGEFIGKGNFGKVVIITHKKTKQKRACKIFVIQNSNEWRLIKREIDLLKKLNHPNIIKLYETYVEDYKIFLIIELCVGGQLFDRIIHHYEILKVPITEKEVCNWIRQILSACAYCHERGVVHRDLKPENILFFDNTPNSFIKVIDFGLSSTMDMIRSSMYKIKVKKKGVGATIARIFPTLNGKALFSNYVNRTRMPIAGTLHYMAPEMIKGFYDEKCDIFSVGIIMYQLFCGTHPFYIPNKDNQKSTKQKILNSDESFSGAAWKFVSSAAKNLLKLMLRKDPNKRINAKEALSHEWFKIQSNFLNDDKIKLTMSVFEGLSNWQSQNRIKQAVLQLLAKELNENDILELREKFELIDKEHDGTITLDELKLSLKNSGFVVLQDELQQIINSIDSSGKEKIGYNEFISALLANRINVEEWQLHEIFDKLDDKKEGKISIDALRKKLKNTKYGTVKHSQMETLFAEMDENCDGYVDFKEFMHLMKN